MRIPDAFTLAGNRWHVEYKTKGEMTQEEEVVYGLCHESTYELWIWKRLGHTRRLQTFLHEVGHALLYTMGYLDKHDEVMVEAVSQLVYQLLSTQEFITDESTDVGDTQPEGV